MAIDINKIINESIQHTIDSVKEPVEMLTESENYYTPKQEYHYEGDSMSDFSPAIASAISAGLGALTFRNKLRSINESRQLSRGGKAALGVAGAGAAGLGGVTALGRYGYAEGKVGRHQNPDGTFNVPAVSALGRDEAGNIIRPGLYDSLGRGGELVGRGFKKLRYGAEKTTE